MRLAFGCGRRTLTFAFVAVVGTLFGLDPAQAQDPGTGAEAFNNCPADVATIGQTINCLFSFRNTGDFPAQVTAMTETSPFPGGTVANISCTVLGGAVID